MRNKLQLQPRQRICQTGSRAIQYSEQCIPGLAPLGRHCLELIMQVSRLCTCTQGSEIGGASKLGSLSLVGRYGAASPCASSVAPWQSAQGGAPCAPDPVCMHRATQMHLEAEHCSSATTLQAVETPQVATGRQHQAIRHWRQQPAIDRSKPREPTRLPHRLSFLLACAAARLSPSWSGESIHTTPVGAPSGAPPAGLRAPRPAGWVDSDMDSFMQ